MEKKVRIPREKIIIINPNFVYFLENGKVFRGKRKIAKSRAYLGCLESTRNLLVVEKSIKKIEFINITCNSKLVEILKRHGVKIIR